MATLKLAVLISGSGTNLQALIDACAADDFPAEITLVVANRPGAFGLERARKAGIETVTIDHTAYPDREAFEDALHEALSAAKVQLVCMAGFMRILTAGFVRRWQDRLINIHPSLLPAYRGLNTTERAIEDGVRFAGCTVHYVRPDVDTGPIIIQAAVPVLTDDTADTLSARILTQEHIIYPEAVRLIASGKARVRGHKVIIDDMPVPDGAYIAPVPAS